MECDISTIYRLADKNDVSNLSVLLWEHTEEFSQVDIALKDDYILKCCEHINNRLDKDLYCYIAEYNGIIISHIFLLITLKLPKIGRPNASYARISTVRTVPEYRNKGIGSKLMNYMKDFCIEKNVEELVVFGPRKESIRFYEKTGFKNENEVMEINFFD